MFWELLPEDVIGKLVDLSCAKVERELKPENTIWKRPQEGLGRKIENSTRMMHLREYTLSEFWDIFVDDRPFGADALGGNEHDQSKAVFSFAMTLMDKIQRWEDEERVGSKLATCMWIYTKEALTKGKIQNPAIEEYLKKRMLSIMLCTNWVCAGTFVDHEWVSESTIAQHEVEILGMELNYKIGVLCVAQ